MSMFLYYFAHTTWNQLRKLIRTWAFSLVVVLLTMGGLVAYAVRWYYQRLSTVEGIMPEDIMEFFEAEGMTGLDALELAVGLVALGILVLQVVGAERSVSRLFLPADVNLLFASPRSPQTVLVFRLLTTLGMAFATQLLLMLQVPWLMHRFRLTPLAAVSVPLAWGLLLGFSVLLKALVYEMGSQHAFLRKNLFWIVLGALAVLGFAFYTGYRQSEEQSLLLSAHRFFNAPGTRAIPVWGWVKGFMLCAFEGDHAQSLCYLGLSVGLIAVLVVAVFTMPCDYYEETVNRTHRIALLLESYRQDGVRSLSNFLLSSRRVLRNASFGHGQGSNVYFYKVLHERFRFSRFLTRTGVTYLLVAVGVGFFDRKFMDSPLPYIPVLALAAMVFFRSLLSPVTEDIRKASFLMQPDPIWEKLFFSMLGGCCNCALDVALPLMVGSAVAGFSPLDGLPYVPVLMGVDFLAAAVGAFVEVSLPQAIGTTFRQVIQALLLYVGLVFDGMLLTSSIVGGNPAVGFALVTAINLVFGAFFLGLTGVWLYPSQGQVKLATHPDVAEAKKGYASVGVALAGMYLAIHGCQMLLAAVPSMPSVVALYLPLYAVGLPVFLLLSRSWRCDASERGEGRLGIWQLLALIPLCFFVMYAGSIVGNLLWGFLMMLGLPSLSLPIPESAGELLLVQAFFVVVLSPLMEEYIFRRRVIERVLPYGERTAVLVSALLFGLSHRTINQFCYAFLLGLVFGYVYVKTRRLRYSVCLHMLINALSSLVLTAILMGIMESMSYQEMLQQPVADMLGEPGVMALLLYLVFLFVCSLFGAVEIAFVVRERPLPKDGLGLRVAFSSWGMLAFVIMALVGIYASL